MNLPNIKLKLFKVKVKNMIYNEALGKHIGDFLPNDKSIVKRAVNKLNAIMEYTGYKEEYIELEYAQKKEIFVIGKSLGQVASLLESLSIKAHQITELDITLDATKLEE